MRGMAFEVTNFQQTSLEPNKIKEGKQSFNGNNNNEPISVLDTRRSPSPSTSTSTLSSSFNTTATPPPAVTFSGEPQKCSPQGMFFSGFPLKNDWPEIQPEFDWENLLSGEFDESSLIFQQLLQTHQVDQNAPGGTLENVGVYPFVNTLQAIVPESRYEYENVEKVPVSDPGFQKDPISHLGFQKELISYPGFQKDQILNQGLVKSSVFGAKQEPVENVSVPVSDNNQHHQYQVMSDQLFAAAELMLSGNFSHAQGILARLNHQFSLASAQAPNKPFQRAAFYFKEAFQMHLQAILSDSNVNPNRITPQFNGMFKMGAYKMFSEVSPIVQFMNFTSNQTILEALGDAKNIHIIDFDIGFGAQWASFIQELPIRNNTNGGCSLKITAFASPSTHHPIELGLMHENLSQFAQEIGISFELEVVNFDSFDPRSFSVSGNEAIAVNLPIWSALTHLSAIPSILHFVKQLSPRIVMSLDCGCERTDLPFPHYLLQGLQYYEVLLDSFDGANVVSEASNKIERFLFQPQIERMVLGKLQSPDPMPHWKSLFTAGGYAPVLLSNFAETQADCVVKRMQVQGFRIEKRLVSLVLCWKNRELMTVSAWKC